MRLVALFIAVASLAPIADAQTGDVVVAADEGSMLRPIARFDGREWRQTCEVSGVAAAARGAAGNSLRRGSPPVRRVPRDGDCKSPCLGACGAGSIRPSNPAPEIL